MLCLTARYRDESVRLPLGESEGRLGFSRENDFVVPYPGVSKIHALVSRHGQGVRLRDLGSRNGLLIDGRRLEEVTLMPGESVQIGRAVLILGEARTSEFEIGIEVKPAANGAPKKGATTARGHSSSGVHSPAAALRLIRELERGGDDLRSRAPDVLSRLRGVLDADTVALVEFGGEDLAIQAAAGVFPVRRSFHGLEVGDALAGEPARTTRDPDGGYRAAAGWKQNGSEAALVSFFGSAARHVASWERELTSYVAFRLATSGGARPPAARLVPEKGLVVPAGMVLGASLATKRLLSQLQTTVRSRMDVLLTGETGTGKELFARLIHESGLYARGPFVAINCAAIPADLLESQLFGVHARVATGVDPHPGLLAQAERGALFLDEIGELAEPLQAKLLRFLQEREIHPLGAPSPRKVDLLVISSSNRDLHEAVRQGTFRADLYYRLGGLRFHIPPLRDRKEDIPGLVLEFVRRAADEADKRITGVSRKALDLLMAFHWPGNIRELQSEVRGAVLVCPSGSLLMPEHFGPVKWVAERSSPTAPPPPSPAVDRGSEQAAPLQPIAAERRKLQDEVDSVERKAILAALAATGGNKSNAAKLLGVTRAGLAMKMRRLLGGDRP